MRLEEPRAHAAGEILGAALAFCRRRLGVLLASTLPIIATISVLTTYLSSRGSLIAGGLSTLLSPLVAAIATAVMMEERQSLEGEESGVNVSRVFDRLRGRWSPLIAVGFLQGLATLVGFALLIIPGFFVVAMTATAPVVIVDDRSTDIFGAFRRAKELSTDLVGHILGTLLLAWIVVGVSSSLASFVVMGLGQLVFGLRVSMFLGQFVSSALYVVSGAVLAYLYADLRDRERLRTASNPTPLRSVLNDRADS